MSYLKKSPIIVLRGIVSEIRRANPKVCSYSAIKFVVEKYGFLATDV